MLVLRFRRFDRRWAGPTRHQDGHRRQVGGQGEPQEHPHGGADGQCSLALDAAPVTRSIHWERLPRGGGATEFRYRLPPQRRRRDPRIWKRVVETVPAAHLSLAYCNLPRTGRNRLWNPFSPQEVVEEYHGRCCCCSCCFGCPRRPRSVISSAFGLKKCGVEEMK